MDRKVKASHGNKKIEKDPGYEVDLSSYLREKYSYEDLIELYSRFSPGESAFDGMMRRILWRALCKSLGDGLAVQNFVKFKHIETFEIGGGVFIGSHTFIQGRFDGKCAIGDHAWIGPKSYLDARDMIIEEYAGLGPGVRVLGSTHTGKPVDVPIIRTDLRIRSVSIGAWSDIGTNAVILPGVTIGKGSIVGAGAVVTRDVPPFAVVSGVPAKFMKWREGHEPGREK